MNQLLGNRYKITRVFADSGGMGLIYAAADTRCANNLVLIKTTRYDTGRHATHFRYTTQEAEAQITKTRGILNWEKKMLVRFRNDALNNIPSPNDFFYDRSLTLKPQYSGKNGVFPISDTILQSEPYLVMEYIDGDILENKMREPEYRAKLEENLLALCREMLTTLLRLHRQVEEKGHHVHFLYQDMKPANILVSHNTYYTLIDFGGVTMVLNERTTEPTAGCITPGYAAPEATPGREHLIDQRFDIYTLGATLWHAVTLKDPRELGSDFPNLAARELVPHNISKPFIRIIARALARDPEQRYQSAAEMRKDVMAHLQTLRTAQTPET